MNLGTETGSLINHLMSRSAGRQTPELGMGVTMLCWTDRIAGTIVFVTKRTIVVQADRATRTDGNGLSESQDYEYARDPAGALTKFNLQRDGSYREGKRGKGITLGVRRQYYDFSF